MDDRPRRNIKGFLYSRITVMLLEFAWTLLGFILLCILVHFAISSEIHVIIVYNL